MILKRYLIKALATLNSDLPLSVYEQAYQILSQKVANKTLGISNKEKYDLLKNGIPVSYTNNRGELVKKKLKVFDYTNYTNNDFLAVRQLEFVDELYSRRPDVIGFVNGIPLVFFDLKAHCHDLRNSYNDNIKDYKDTIAQLMAKNHQYIGVNKVL